MDNRLTRRKNSTIIKQLISAGIEGYCQPCLLLPVSKLKAGVDRNLFPVLRS